MRIIHAAALMFICLLVMVIPVDSLVSPAGIPLVKLAGLMGLACVVILIASGAELHGSGWFIWICLLYLSWVVASFLWTSMPVNYQHAHAINSQQSIKSHLYLLGLVLLTFQVIRSEQSLQCVFAAFVLGCSWLIALLMSNYEPGVRTVRHGLTLLDANEMTVMISIAIPLAVYLMVLGEVLLWRLLGLLYLPVAMIAILVTGSRTGLVVMSVGLLSLLVLFLKANLFMRLLSMVLLGATLIWVVNIIPDKTIERLLSTKSELSSGTLSERSITWKKAWQEFERQPVIGHGLGSFRQLMNKHNVEYTAHNSYISIAVEQGIIGLILYLCLLLTVFWNCLSLNSTKRWLLLPLLLIVALGQMTLTLHETMYVWFAYLVIVLSGHIHREQPHQEPFLIQEAADAGR